MTTTPFWLKLDSKVREKLDEQIRARGYADCYGISNWLSERGYCVGKSAVNRYIKRLREQEQPDLQLPPATIRAAIDFARTLQTLLNQLPEGTP